MLDWWENNGPPVYVAAAAYLGLIKAPGKKKKNGKVDASAGKGNLDELLKLAGPGGMIN